MVRAGVVFWQVAEGANGRAACLLLLVFAVVGEGWGGWGLVVAGTFCLLPFNLAAA